jgi:DNA-binding response OmpR family regulator
MAERRILVVEDDAAIRQGIVDALAYAGYTTFEAGDGRTGLRMAVECDCDLLLLDLVLPHKDGLEILTEVRVTRPVLPVIILTARGGESDRIRGLQLGADDYVVKPFSVGELLARVQAVLRRSPERPSDLTALAIPGGTVDLARREARFDDGERVELSERESELLRYLAMNAGRAISRDEILARVWRLDPKGVETRTIDMHVARLREKLRDGASPAKVVLTVRGKGYSLGTDATSMAAGGEAS